MTPEIELRRTTIEDLEQLFFFQLDDEASYMAAFVPENRHDKDAYIAKCSKNIASDSTYTDTITWNGDIVGSVLTYDLLGDLQISYWITKEFWGKGVATMALKKFLTLYPERPLYGRVAFDNAGSIKVLEKCGFKQIAIERFYAGARGQEIEEFVFILE